MTELEKENEKLKETVENLLKIQYALADSCNKYSRALEEIREIVKHWLNNDWSCYHCRSNMDEKLKEIIKLTRF